MSEGTSFSANIWLADDMKIAQSEKDSTTKFVELFHTGDRGTVTFYIWSADAADELAEALKGVAAGMRKGDGG